MHWTYPPLRPLAWAETSRKEQGKDEQRKGGELGQPVLAGIVAAGIDVTAGMIS